MPETRGGNNGGTVPRVGINLSMREFVFMEYFHEQMDEYILELVRAKRTVENIEMSEAMTKVMILSFKLGQRYVYKYHADKLNG